MRPVVAVATIGMMVLAGCASGPPQATPTLESAANTPTATLTETASPTPSPTPTPTPVEIDYCDARSDEAAPPPPTPEGLTISEARARASDALENDIELVADGSLGNGGSCIRNTTATEIDVKVWEDYYDNCERRDSDLHWDGTAVATYRVTPNSTTQISGGDIEEC